MICDECDVATHTDSRVSGVDVYRMLECVIKYLILGINQRRMPACAVRLCKNNTTRHKKKNGITYHLFPVDPDICNRWIAVVRSGRESWWKPGKRSVICSAHFNPSDFYLTPSGLIRLYKGAVPENALFVSSVRDVFDNSTVTPELNTSASFVNSNNIAVAAVVDSNRSKVLHTADKKAKAAAEKRPAEQVPDVVDDNAVAAAKRSAEQVPDVVDDNAVAAAKRSAEQVSIDHTYGRRPVEDVVEAPQEPPQQPTLEIPDGRVLISRVYHYLCGEYEQLKALCPGCDLAPLSDVLARTARATGLDEETVARVLQESDQGQGCSEDERRVLRESDQETVSVKQEPSCSDDEKDLEDNLNDDPLEEPDDDSQPSVIKEEPMDIHDEEPRFHQTFTHTARKRDHNIGETRTTTSKRNKTDAIHSVSETEVKMELKDEFPQAWSGDPGDPLARRRPRLRQDRTCTRRQPLQNIELSRACAM